MYIKYMISGGYKSPVECTSDQFSKRYYTLYNVYTNE